MKSVFSALFIIDQTFGINVLQNKQNQVYSESFSLGDTIFFVTDVVETFGDLYIFFASNEEFCDETC